MKKGLILCEAEKEMRMEFLRRCKDSYQDDSNFSPENYNNYSYMMLGKVEHNLDEKRGILFAYTKEKKIIYVTFFYTMLVNDKQQFVMEWPFIKNPNNYPKINGVSL